MILGLPPMATLIPIRLVSMLPFWLTSLKIKLQHLLFIKIIQILRCSIFSLFLLLYIFFIEAGYILAAPSYGFRCLRLPACLCTCPSLTCMMMWFVTISKGYEAHEFTKFNIILWHKDSREQIAISVALSFQYK